jgi:ABC-type uncharacterized transport system involved in gliding motility auxiliary subunit
MKRLIPGLGVAGVILGIGGLVVYSLDPGKLWLVTLVEALALVCLIVFFATHYETVKAFSARRSTRMGLNSIVMVLLFIVILAIANFLVARHSTRWDFSETGHFTLAPQTFQVLRGLTQDVKFTVFSQDRSPLYATYRDLLDSYKQASDKIKVEFVDPERKPGVARQYGITRMDTAVVESGEQSTRVTPTLRSTGEPTLSESDLTGAIIRMSKTTKKRILFLEGHGERSLTDTERGGFAVLKEALTKQGYDSATVSLLQESAVPEHTAVLVLGGPRRPVTPEEQERIANYVSA